MHCYQCANTLTTLVNRQSGWTIYRCSVCGLVQIAPRPTLKEIAKLYKNDWEHFSAYRSQMSAHYEYFHQVLSFIKKINPGGKTLLDIGCAVGALLEIAQKYGVSATGLDVSSDAVSFCRKQGLQAENLLVQEWQKKHSNKQFDIITALEVIEHEYDPISFVRTIYQILKPGGMVIVTTPNFNSFWRRIMGQYWVGYQHPEHLWFFTPVTLRRLFEKQGFTDIKIRKDFIRPYRISYAFRRLADYFPVGAPLFRLLQQISDRLHLIVPVNPWSDMMLIAKKQT